MTCKWKPNIQTFRMCPKERNIYGRWGMVSSFIRNILVSPFTSSEICFYITNLNSFCRPFLIVLISMRFILSRYILSYCKEKILIHTRLYIFNIYFISEMTCHLLYYQTRIPSPSSSYLRTLNSMKLKKKRV